MEATFSSLLLLQKYINLKQKSQTKKDCFRIFSVSLANISKDLTINNMKKTGIKGVLNFFLC